MLESLTALVFGLLASFGIHEIPEINPAKTEVVYPNPESPHDTEEPGQEAGTLVEPNG